MFEFKYKLKKKHYYWKILEAMYVSLHSLSSIQSLFVAYICADRYSWTNLCWASIIIAIVSI